MYSGTAAPAGPAALCHVSSMGLTQVLFTVHGMRSMYFISKSLAPKDGLSSPASASRPSQFSIELNRPMSS